MLRFSALALGSVLTLGCAGEPVESPARPGGKADTLGNCSEDATCFQARSYEVLFTNPLCQLYEYDEALETVSGDEVTAKPKNVYCTKDDSELSGARPESPQFRLEEWIGELDDGDELFLAYLSFSNPVVTDALCEAAERGVEIDFVLDKMSSSAETLDECGGRVHIRGHQGSVGFQHNKILMVNPAAPGPNDSEDDEDFIRMVFSSGNMSSGAVLHHENWHFVEATRASFFVEYHRCLIEALLEPEHTDGKGNFRSFMNECRDEISFEEEEDLKVFFIPNLDDSKAALANLEARLSGAGSVDIAAHRFSLSEMLNTLEGRLESEEDFQVRLVADDDLYWTNPAVGSGAEVGPNLFFEGLNVERLEDAGEGERFEARYLETPSNRFLLHHNKFIIFRDEESQPDSVLYGAANLTGTGFKTNLENIYWTDIPLVVDAFKAQYGRFWDGDALPGSDAEPPMATAVQDMPIVLENPNAPD